MPLIRDCLATVLALAFLAFCLSVLREGPPHLGALLPNAALIAISLVAATALHEAGHALVAAHFGYRISRVVLGGDEAVVRIKHGPLRIVIGAKITSGGLTLAVPGAGECSRLRETLVNLAGPAANAILLGLCILLGAEPAELHEPLLAGPALGPVGAFALANAWCLVFSLLPISFDTGFGRLPSDGLRSLRGKRAECGLLEQHADTLALEAAFLIVDREYALAAKHCEEAARIAPERVSVIQTQAFLLLDWKQDFAAAREAFLRAAEKSPHVRHQALVRNNAAWAGLFLGDPGLLPEADRVSKDHLARFPRACWANGTRGAVLECLGRHVEAMMFLDTAIALATSDATRAHFTSWRALAEFSAGDEETARRSLQHARKLDAHSYSVRHVEARIPEAAMRGRPAA